MDKDLPSSFCFASLIPDLMPTVLYVCVRTQLTLNWRKNTKKKKKKNVCQNTYASTKHWLLCTWLNARARRKRKKQQKKKTPSFCFEKIVLSRFSLKGAQKKNESQKLIFHKKNKKKLFPCLRSCWFIYVMESLLSLRLCSPGLKQNKTKKTKNKNTPTSSDKLCLSSAPLLCCGSLSSKNTLAQSSLSVDRPTAEGGRKQRRPITWIAGWSCWLSFCPHATCIRWSFSYF